MCPRQCRTHRLQDDRGNCGIGRNAVISSCFPHLGEENCLRGWKGSGTIFFSGCNLQCVFCQNYDISWRVEGEEFAPRQLAEAMLELQDRGCHNINLVTPSHVVAQFLEALVLAVPMGLHLPIVYNTSGYDSIGNLRLLEGIVDVYMPDIKFSSDRVADCFTRGRDYASTARRAIREMHRQVGDLVIDTRGLAVRGLLVRHLVMPGGLAGSEESMRFLAGEVSPLTYVNIMGQYRASGHAVHYPELRGRPTGNQYAAARNAARSAGLCRIDGFE
jgi:putative pyruvate formate lyase activating enzyme